MVYTLQKFKNYLLGAHFKTYTNHSTLNYLVNKPVLVGGAIYRSFLLFQEYDFEVIVKPGRLNAGPNHLSQIENGEEPTKIGEGFPDAQLFVVKVAYKNCIDIIQFLSNGVASEGYTTHQKKELVVMDTIVFFYRGEII